MHRRPGGRAAAGDAHGAEQVLREICGARVRPKKGMATFYQADFASLAEVRGLAEAVLRDRERIPWFNSIEKAGSGIDNLTPAEKRRLKATGAELWLAALNPEVRRVVERAPLARNFSSQNFKYSPPPVGDESRPSVNA